MPNRKLQTNSKKIHKIRRIPCNREKIKIIVLFRSYTTRNRKLKKNSIKIQKTIKYYYGFISSQNKGGNGNKNYRSVPFQPDA